MARRALGWCLLFGVAAAGWWCGCNPNALLPPDERRDADVVKARRAMALGDFDEAAQHLERALDAHPTAAHTHLAYAILCDQRLNRCPEAAYHYRRYLKLKPDDPRAEEIRRRVTNCTERLALSVPMIIRSESIARELDRVRRENDHLKLELQRLNEALVTRSNQVQQLLAASRPAAATGTLPTVARAEIAGNESARSPTPTFARPTSGNAPTEPSAARVHVVRSGETIAQIARRRSRDPGRASGQSGR